MTGLPPIRSEARGRRIALVALLAVAEAGAAGLVAFGTRDAFAAFGAAPAVAWDAVITIAAGGIAIAGLRAAGRIVAERLGQEYAAALRMALFEHVTRLPAGEVARHQKGALSLRFVGDLAAARGWVSLGIARTISAAIVLPLVGCILFLLDPLLGFAAMLPLGLGVVGMTFLAASLRPLHRRVRARRARLASDVAERLPHGPELRLLGRIERERSRLSRRSAMLISAAVRRARASGMLQAAPEAASGVAAASVLAAALAADLPSGHAAAALAVLGILSGTLRDLAGCWNRRQAWLVARRRCEALLATRPLKRARRASQPPLSGAALPVRFRGVTAGPLRKIDLEVAPGARIAIVGPNGAGKSTLISLAAGLESPRAGKVTVGGRSPLALGPAERRLIHRIAPDSLILAGSLRRALTMGSARRQDDAAVLARAGEFGLGPVLSRLGGLDGRVAEQARSLSSGEAQRIRLARASLSGARLLLLDEPETGLDSEAALLVLKLLDSLGCTCVMATHDLELARSMDELWEVSGASIHPNRREKGLPIDQTVVPARHEKALQ